jgi:protein arginine N-methyltransferase 1
MNPVSGYSIGAYGAMVADNVRMNAYAAALRKEIRPDSVVMDIGAGTGIWSLLSCQYGAKHVYAVEPDDSIHTARELAKANCYADRITFLQEISTRVVLPERANIIVSDLRGTLPFFENHIASIVDARARHLAPGGILIPQRDIVWACPVEAAEAYQRHLGPWGSNVFGVDFSSKRRAAVNRFHYDQMKPENLLAEPQALAELDYNTITESNFRSKLHWKVQRAGIVHGISLWFSAELADGIGFSTGPENEPLIYGMALVLLSEPVNVAEGDLIEAEFRGNLVNGSYIWQWQTRVYGGENNGTIKADFRQSTFDASSLNIEKLRKRASTYVPQRNDEGEMEFLALNLMDGKTSLEEISRKLTDAFPEQYPTWQEALGWVGWLSVKKSR